MVPPRLSVCGKHGTMTHDLSQVIGVNPGEAIFLPAFQLPTIADISNPNARAIFPGSAELNWFDPTNEHFSHCAGLYSLGQSTLGLNNPAEGMITHRDRDHTLMVADSGGYQLGKNTFKAIEGKMSPEFLQSREYDDVRLKVLQWMEAYADYGMTIDFPAWAIDREEFIFNKFKQCLNESRRNMEFFRDNLSGRSKLKLLSVVQGRNITEALSWYESIKNIQNFTYSGWSFAGPIVWDPTMALRLILKMLKDNRLNENENWIHMLGRGSANAIFVFNVFQQCLDEYIGKGIRISFDVSTPFKEAGQHGKVYTHLQQTDGGYSMPLTKYNDLDSLVKLVSKYPINVKWCGPFDEDVIINELEVEITEKHKYGLDTKSVAYLAHRNLYLYYKALSILVWNTKSLMASQSTTVFPDILRRFRVDVRAVFEKFATTRMSDDQIKYLDISRDYEKLL